MLANVRKITDEFAEKLVLTKDQILLIDEVEHKLYKDYEWDKIKSQESLKYLLLIKIYRLLSDEQTSILKELRDKYNAKRLKQDQIRYQEILQRNRKTLEPLGLSEEQLVNFVDIIDERRKAVWKLKRSSEQSGKGIKIKDIIRKVQIDACRKIFTDTQIEKYKQVLDEQDLQNRRESVKHIYYNFQSNFKIELTKQQAEAISSHDNKRMSKDEEFYSEWEQMEIKYEAYQNILTSEQFNLYLPFHQQRIKRIEESKLRSNENLKNEITRSFNLLAFCKNVVLPERCSARKRIEELLTAKQKDLIIKIKIKYDEKLAREDAEYRKSLRRHNRNLVPNELKSWELSQKIRFILPNVCNVKNSKLVEQLLTPDVIKLIEDEEVKLKPIYEKLRIFNIENYEKTGGTYGGVTFKIRNDEELENLSSLSLLLIEPSLDDNLDKING